MSKVVTFVVPKGTGGVRDYADLMVDALRKTGVDARVFAWTQSDVHAIDPHILASDCIYLQYSGYGYAKRGAPLWMLHYLRSRRPKIKHLGVFFHELFAFGPPWSSAFWLSPLQRSVAAGLARLADFWQTNRERSWQWLANQAPTVPNAKLPVFSNVGETTRYEAARERSVIVFGGSARRRNTYRAAGKPLFTWIRRNDLQLHDVGPPLCDERLDRLLVQNGVRRHGRLELEAVGDLCSRAMFGIHAGSSEYVEKSGVFAAYCAHGVAPLLIAPRYSRGGPVEAGRHYFTTAIFDGTLPAEQQEVGEAAWTWYRGHTLQVHLQSLFKEISPQH